jgi:hypothetical protein
MMKINIIEIKDLRNINIIIIFYPETLYCKCGEFMKSTEKYNALSCGGMQYF